MKLYLSVDMEGICGVAAWDEVTKGHHDYPPHRDQMAAEAATVCKAALANGFDEIVVKDAHATARNLLPTDLPKGCRLIRGWSNHPYMMVQDIDDSYDAIAFVGYHSAAYTDGNPLAHTMSSSTFARTRLNGDPLSEWRLHSYIAASHGVPCILCSGDEALGREVAEYSPYAASVVTGSGVGNSMVSRQPEQVLEELQAATSKAAATLAKQSPLPLPGSFELEVTFREHQAAYRAQFFPGAERKDPATVVYRSDRIYDIAVALNFF